MEEILSVAMEFYPEKATAILTVDKKSINLETKREAAIQLGLSEKNEFHFTIIGSDTGEEILKSLENSSESERNRVIGQIRELCESFDWKVTLEHEFYFLKKNYDNPDSIDSEISVPEERKSIIQMAKIENLDEFYQKLNMLLSKNFNTPLPHVTLYTTSTREDKKLRGIGIYSRDQFEELNPEEI